MSVGVALLLSDNLGEARVLASELDALNQTRKEIEQGMQAEALTLCENWNAAGIRCRAASLCTILNGIRGGRYSGVAY
jgi:single-stranded DNA-specific DHH superfamily exonuclease